MSLYAACFGNGLVHIFAFVATATELRRQLVCTSFIVSLLKTYPFYQGKNVWDVLATVAWVATYLEQLLVTVCFEFRSLTNWLPSMRDLVSKNTWLSLEISLVNVMVLWNAFALSKNSCKSLRPWRHCMSMSSVKRSHMCGFRGTKMSSWFFLQITH